MKIRESGRGNLATSGDIRGVMGKITGGLSPAVDTGMPDDEDDDKKNRYIQLYGQR